MTNLRFLGETSTWLYKIIIPSRTRLVESWKFSGIRKIPTNREISLARFFTKKAKKTKTTTGARS